MYTSSSGSLPSQSKTGFDLALDNPRLSETNAALAYALQKWIGDFSNGDSGARTVGHFSPKQGDVWYVYLSTSQHSFRSREPFVIHFAVSVRDGVHNPSDRVVFSRV